MTIQFQIINKRNIQRVSVLIIYIGLFIDFSSLIDDRGKGLIQKIKPAKRKFGFHSFYVMECRPGIFTSAPEAP